MKRSSIFLLTVSAIAALFAHARRMRMTALVLLLTVLAFSASLQLAYAATTRYVSTSGTDSGDCSVNPCATLAYAIAQSVAGDTIQIAAGTYTQLGMTVDRDLTFSGASAATTIIQAAATPFTANGRLFFVNWGKTATFENLTIRNGKVPYGGGIYNDGGTVNVANSTFSGNSAGSGGGGGIHNNSGTLNVANSTFSGNSATNGGGIDSYGGTLNVANSTFSGNSAQNGGVGGGIENDFSTMYLKNTIVTNTPNGGDCYNDSGTIAGSNNLIDDTTCGSAAAFRLGAVTHFVKTLKNNGQATPGGTPTKTHALQPGSNAINAVPSGQCTYVSSGTNPLFTDGATIPTDQRGGIRPQQSGCDIGAYEHGALKPGKPRGLRAINLGNGQEQLKWKWTRDAFKYKVVVKDSGGNVLFSQNTGKTFLTTALGSGSFTWSVTAINALGRTTSNIGSFTR